MIKHKSKVYIVGAGPGYWQLISVRGLNILRQADCIIYDRLVGKELLSLANPDAKLIYVGKSPDKPLEQQEINRVIIKNARLYKTVVRLKGGDPMIFGRATEELKCLIDNKIDFEIVPGITAASAAAACSGTVLTDRNTASTVSFVTAQPAKGRKDNIDLHGLIRLKGTIVFYMVVKNAQQICQKLLSAGLAPDTAAVVVANASLAGQKIIKGVVSNIARKCDDATVMPPAVLIVGEKCLTWLQAQPLFGKKILITRDTSGNADFAYKLATRGAEAICYPTFEIKDLTGKREFRQIISRISDFDWVFFTSPTGIRLFFRAIYKLKRDTRIFSSSKIACIGPETASVLQEHGIQADFMPSDFTSRRLADDFVKKFKPVGKKILLLRSARADATLTEKLKSAKATVRTFTLYTTEKLKNENTEIPEQLIKGYFDWITFTSGFAVECFFQDFNIRSINKKIKIASIGPTTSETLEKFGIKPAAVAKNHTIDGLIESIEEIERYSAKG